MRLSMVMCKQPSSTLGIPKLDLLSPPLPLPPPPPQKVVIVIGATGTGKSRVSIDLALRFPSEIVNSDKMQVYEGLDIVTNKVSEEERRGVPHHLLGIANPNFDFTLKNYCDSASIAIDSILDKDRLPIIVGGSNSHVEALMDRSRYECCFLWIDVSMPVLHNYVSKRVDQMVASGMVDEARQFFNPSGDYSKGIRRSIGVPEFDKYFRNEMFFDTKTRARLLEEAIQEIKDNTCRLACRQVEKIRRLRNIKRWNLHRVDATQVFQMHGEEEAEMTWKRTVAGPSAAIVQEFLYKFAGEIFPDSFLSMRDRSLECLVP